MCLNDAQTLLYVGTLGCEVYQVPIDFKKKSIGAPKALVSGHYAPAMQDNNEVWGLAVFPGGTQYVSVSDDATLRVWDSAQRK